MTRNIISTSSAPAAIGAYSQGTATEGLVFTSGQLGIDPATGELVEGIDAQAMQAMKNVEAILKEAGSGFDKALKVTIFLSDIANFAVVNEIYQGFFTTGEFPARSALQVGALPKAGLVEIEAIATR